MENQTDTTAAESAPGLGCALVIPPALYSCLICREDYSWPAEDLYWSAAKKAWICHECWDEEVHGDPQHAISLADEIARRSIAGVARRAHDAAWSATSKLESQINRLPALPPAYKTIMQESFDALRDLDAAIRAHNNSVVRIPPAPEN